MAFQERDNSGALFKNERKEKENQPDYKGTAMVNGVVVEVAAWIKEAKTSGKPFLSLSFKAKEEFAAPKAQSSGFSGAPRPQQDSGFLPF